MQFPVRPKRPLHLHYCGIFYGVLLLGRVEEYLTALCLANNFLGPTCFTGHDSILLEFDTIFAIASNGDAPSVEVASSHLVAVLVKDHQIDCVLNSGQFQLFRY